MKVFLNGELLNESEARVSAFDEGLLYGYGVYETLHAYDGVVFKLEEHLNRLSNSLSRLQIKSPFSKKQVEDAVNKTLSANNLRDAAVRVTLTAGSQSSWGRARQSLIVMARPAPEKPVQLEAITVSFHRDVALAKSLNCLTSVLAQKKAHEAKAGEALFTQNGFVLEGTASNLFIVKKGVLYTPEENVLHGITRNVVIELSEKNGLKVCRQPVLAKELYSADEAFLTSTLKEIVPLVNVDGRQLRRGTIEQRLQKAYKEAVRDEIARARKNP